MNTSRGFTIIELLIVVAIIAVLTGIVLVSVVAYINKGKDAAIQGNLNTIVTNGAEYFDRTSSFSGFCADQYFIGPQDAITIAGGIAICNTNTDDPIDTAFCACSTMKVIPGDTFCVDSSGYKKETGTDCATRCPAATAACVD